MRFRLGVGTGFAAGYYLGARAGRQRYEQINRQLSRLRRSEAFEEVTERAKTVVEEGVEKAREVVESRTGNGQGDSEATTLTIAGPPVQAAPPPPPTVTDPEAPEPPKGLGGYSSSR